MSNQQTLDAWNKFLKVGGIEPNGRDKDFVDALRNYLDPKATTIEEAVSSSTTDMLVKGFFSGIAPFSTMMLEIMKFFTQASEKYGKNQWEISVDGAFLDEDEFQKFNHFVEKSQKTFCVPDFDYSGGWCIFDVASQFEEIKKNLQKIFFRKYVTTGDNDVDDWLLFYSTLHKYTHLPQAILTLINGNKPISDIAALYLIVYENIVSRWEDFDSLLSQLSLYKSGSDKFLSINTIARNETDLWLGKTMICLAGYLQLDDTKKREFNSLLREKLNQYEYINYSISTNSDDLEKLLSFPVWHKRHELYAVWIATEITSAIQEHDVELHAHTDDGKLTFPFKQTLIATVHSSAPELQLYAEKYETLDSPKGKGRKAGVQPDYSLWQEKNNVLVCPLVVEVKHYKRNARRSFSHALEDYANAHPDAEILLINHGPVSDMLDNVEQHIKDRCYLIENYHAPSSKNGNLLYEKVRKIAGPIQALAPLSAKNADGEIVVVDISGSMENIVHDRSFRQFMGSFSSNQHLKVALVSTCINDIVSIDSLPEALKHIQFNNNTDLVAALSCIPDSYTKLTLITDQDGKDQIEKAKISVPGNIQILPLSDQFFILTLNRIPG
ncbi:TPA: hypothetical protein ROG05_004445 [Enterobacter soli]|nr:hypothetical protein [Enterobacter soli]